MTLLETIDCCSAPCLRFLSLATMLTLLRTVWIGLVDQTDQFR